MEQTMFLYAIAAASEMPYVDELYGRSHRSIVEDYVLKRVVRPFCLREGECLSRQFMNLMADYGQYCIECHRPSGELLMELAMQRISQGGVRHKPYDMLLALPQKYWNYSAIGDVKEPLDDACVNFLLSNLRFCTENLQNKVWCYHAQLIKNTILSQASKDTTLQCKKYQRLQEVIETLK